MIMFQILIMEFDQLVTGGRDGRVMNDFVQESRLTMMQRKASTI